MTDELKKCFLCSLTGNGGKQMEDACIWRVPWHYRPRAKYRVLRGEVDRWQLLEVSLCKSCAYPPCRDCDQELHSSHSSAWPFLPESSEELTDADIEEFAQEHDYLIGHDWWDAADGLEALLSYTSTVLCGRCNCIGHASKGFTPDRKGISES